MGYTISNKNEEEPFCNLAYRLIDVILGYTISNKNEEEPFCNLAYRLIDVIFEYEKIKKVGLLS